MTASIFPRLLLELLLLKEENDVSELNCAKIEIITRTLPVQSENP